MESIGKYLKKARQKKGVSLLEAANQTRIHHSVLENMESGNFENLPSPMYVKGFLKRYAEYLGVESTPLIDKYLSTHPKDPQQILTLKGEKISPDFLTKFAVPAMIAGVLIVIFLIAFSIIKLLPLHRPDAPPVKAATAEIETKEPSPVAVVSQKKNIISKPGPLTLQAIAKDDLWLEVRCDGNLLFQGMLAKGSVETWKADTKFRLSIGNAGALSLSLNDEPLGILGENGQVLKEVILTKEAVEINPKSEALNPK
ncbi:MAG: DUF4115 domain-containing protein [Candidatus Omnitrophota bacterium]|nr:DUF4115 domain-containing protein [Candidatus Omnitrophota bacterium]